MSVLIVYGSKMGGTAGIARALAESMRAEGLEVDVQPARAVSDTEGYAAVVVGGALYATRWHRDARRFVRTHRGALSRLPVWLFSSGPLDDSAGASEIAPVRQVASAMSRIGARGHRTFGGALPEDATGFPASAMAKEHAGDWRDPVQIAAWGREIAAVLRREAVQA